MSPPERTPVGWPKDNVLINEICNIITSTDNTDLILGISVQGHGEYPNDYVEDKEIYITNDYSKDNKNLKAYELTSLIMDKLSFPSTALSTLHNSNLDSETKKEYLNQLEYDMLYERNYTNEYSKLIPSENYKIGFKDVSINNLEVVDDCITIKGYNFNTFSKVFVNNKEVPTNFIDENTLNINKSDCGNNSIIKVCQLAATASTIFSSSNEVTVNY